MSRWASFRRVVPWMGGHKATVAVTTDAPSRMSLWIDGAFVPIVEADGYLVRGGYLIFRGPVDDTVVFDFDVTQAGNSRFVCRIDDLDIVDRIADLADATSPEENPNHDGESSGHAESGRPA